MHLCIIYVYLYILFCVESSTRFHGIDVVQGYESTVELSLSREDQIFAVFTLAECDDFELGRIIFIKEGDGNTHNAITF